MPIFHDPDRGISRLLNDPAGAYFMEAHDGLSARIVEKASFDGIWASSLALSTVLGKRDANEASWTELIDVAGRLADSVEIPVLLDGDNALGDFNTMRQIVTACGRRGIAGVAVEDKAFPKRNSLLSGVSPLLPTDVFQGIIRAGLDSRPTEDFPVVARTEALIAGRSISETLDRAAAYVEAGADAILVHSKSRGGAEIMQFLRLWAHRSPIVLVPTTYHEIGVDVLVEAGANLIVWGNHLIRAAMSAMSRVATQVCLDRSGADVEPTIARVADLFDIMNYEELDLARKKYH